VVETRRERLIGTARTHVLIQVLTRVLMMVPADVRTHVVAGPGTREISGVSGCMPGIVTGWDAGRDTGWPTRVDARLGARLGARLEPAFVGVLGHQRPEQPMRALWVGGGELASAA
jgi:hypothetical protein